jgi:RNA polymerase sigma factor (sigma-70 family)
MSAAHDPTLHPTGIGCTLIPVEDRINIKALKADDAQEYRAMVELFQDRVFHTCFGFLGSREEAEDAAQETFIAVYSSIRDFREESSLSTWIYRIAVITALQAIRKKRRKRQIALFFPDGSADDALTASRDPDESTHPLLQLENKERAEILYKAMNKLPESQRVAFTLHKIEGMEYKEIAEVMQLSLSSVESLIHRAKINLQKRLQTYYRQNK